MKSEMKNRLQILTVLSHVALGTSLFAVTWNRAIYEGNWGAPENWLDDAGNVAAVCPTNGEDVVLGPYVYDSANKKMYLHKTGSWTGVNSAISLSGGACDPIVGTLSGTHQHFIEHTTYRDYVIQAIRRFKVQAADDFHGFFTTGDALGYLTLDAKGVPLAFANIGAKARLGVEVPTAGETALIESIYEEGAIDKVGAGDLVVKSTQGVRNDIYVHEGGLTLAGFAGGKAAKLKALLADARIHLDASAADSLEKYVDSADGRTCVARWKDVRNTGFAAVTNNWHSSGASLPYERAPFVSEATSPTGLPFVDFGTQNYWAQKYGAIFGPTNCGLHFTESLSNVREAFYVVETPGSAYLCTVLGCKDYSKYDYITQYSSSLFSPLEANTNVWTGEIAINAEAVRIQDTSVYQYTNCYTVSIAANGPTHVSALAIDRNYTDTSGGSRIGEVLLFTNVLSRAERQLVNEYLNTKWRTGDIRRDAGAVILDDGVTAIGVSAGQSVHIRTMVAPNGFTKKGAGTLGLDALQPADALVTVEAGKVSFNQAFTNIATDKPAEGAYLWLDATKEDTLTKAQAGAEYGETEFVTAWKDCREGTNRYATATISGKNAAEAVPPAKPTYVTYAGHKAVSTGDSSAWYSFLRFPTWNTSAKAYAGFIVIRPNTTYWGGNFFGSSDLTFARLGGGKILATNYRHPMAGAAKWSVDGRVIDPWNVPTDLQTRFNGTNGFSVIAFSSAKPLRFDGLAADRTDSSLGGVTYGEVLVFHHPITECERIQTEAYLMKKWLNKDHPETVAAPVNLAYSADNPAVLAGEKDITVATISGGDGTICKEGEGAFTILTNSATALQSITVNAGELSVPLEDPLKALESAMLYHFDATKTDRFETRVENGETNIVTWLDSRGNATPYATSQWPTEFSGIVKDYPALVDVETRSGVTRKMVDFGYKMKSSDSTPAITNSAMLVLNAKMSGVKETFTIWADAHGTVDTPFFAYPDYNLVHVRGWNSNGRLFASTSYCGNWENGRIAIDGAAGSVDSVMPAGVHLLSLCTREDTSFSFTSWGNERRYHAGGCQMGEQIGFARELSAAERTLLEGHLMAKWFSNSPFVVTNSYDSFAVSSGARLVLRPTPANGGAVCVGEITGGGTVAVDSLMATRVTTEDLGSTTFAPLKIEGAFAFAAGAKLTVPCALQNIAAGDYVVLEATSVTGLPTLNAASLKAKYHVGVEIVGGKVILHVRAKGLCLIIR